MKKLFTTLLIGAGLATALAPKVAQASQTGIVERQIINDIQKPTKKRSVTNFIGGLPLVTEYQYTNFGLTPKEYGLRFGNGNSRKKKTNKKHRSHLFKFK